MFGRSHGGLKTLGKNSRSSFQLIGSRCCGVAVAVAACACIPAQQDQRSICERIDGTVRPPPSLHPEVAPIDTSSPDINLTLSDLVELAEEVNTNMAVLVRRMMQTFQAELEDGKHQELDSLHQALLMQDRFDDLLAR